MHDHPLTIEIRPGAESVVLSVAGELDLSSAPTLRACFEQLDVTVDEVVVDLGGLRFIDSTGLSLLVATERSLAERGGRLALRHPSDQVRRVFEVSGVDKVLTVH